MSQQPTIDVKIPDQLLGGSYANNAIISHTKEEFILDYMFAAPPAGIMVSRVIMSPGHMKRMIAAMQDNIKKYEKAFGKIEEAPSPKTEIGFRP